MHVLTRLLAPDLMAAGLQNDHVVHMVKSKQPQSGAASGCAGAALQLACLLQCSLCRPAARQTLGCSKLQLPRLAYVSPAACVCRAAGAAGASSTAAAPSRSTGTDPIAEAMRTLQFGDSSPAGAGGAGGTQADMMQQMLQSPMTQVGLLAGITAGPACRRVPAG